MSPTDRQELAERLNAAEVLVWQADAALRRCFQCMRPLIETDQNGSNASLLAVLINESLCCLLDALRKPQAAPSEDAAPLQRVERFWKELRDQPEQLTKEWTLDKLAAACGVGRTRFVQYTRLLTNLPPLHYLRLCRLELAAQRLIGRPEQTITAVGLACGFSTGQYFSNAFQQHFGCPPAIFRKKAGKENV